jgi:hypothetical protein
MARGQTQQEPQEPQADPTVKSMAAGDPYPEGTHPARPPSEVTHSADKIKYRDMDDKPDASSIAQLADIPDDWPGQQ